MRSTFVEVFLERKCVFVLTDIPFGYKSRYILHIKTNNKTGKTLLRLTDCYIFKLRRKYAYCRKNLLTPDLIKYKNKEHLLFGVKHSDFLVYCRQSAAVYDYYTRWMTDMNTGLRNISLSLRQISFMSISAYRDGLRNFWVQCNYYFGGAPLTHKNQITIRTPSTEQNSRNINDC